MTRFVRSNLVRCCIVIKLVLIGAWTEARQHHMPATTETSANELASLKERAPSSILRTTERPIMVDLDIYLQATTKAHIRL